MSIITGPKQRLKTYQIMQQNNNNYVYINNDISSNLLYLNADNNSYNDAIINFKNNYQFGLINDKITFNKNNSNLLTIDNSNINIYKNTNFLSNINVNNYLYTSNNTTFFNNNLSINLNDDNNFKINNNNKELLNLNNSNLNINISNIYTSNIYVNDECTLFTNFIDSPNNKPVIINNMAFAESLRILTTNIIHNISIDNSIIWCNIYDFDSKEKPKQGVPFDDATWTRYMIDNNINLNDINFTKPNISILKYISSTIGGSNILEFRTRQLNNNSNLVFSINNNGFINIGSNYTSNIPINININPRSCNCFNIINYSNINNRDNLFSINSNGFINIGSNNFTQNQINITKNNNSNILNNELISLNINTNNFITYNGQYEIPFINNDLYNNFIIFDSGKSIDTETSSLTVDIIDIVITNPFIERNIFSINNGIYNSTDNYTLNASPIKNILDIPTGISNNVLTNLKIPKSLFKIVEDSINNLIYYIYPSSFITIPPYNPNLNLFNIKTLKVENTQTVNLIYTFYIYKYNYNYIYNGLYIPRNTNYLNFNSNNNNNFSVSIDGNTGIGTSYNDIYKLYVPDNALINNINCSIIDNINKRITFSNCTLNNINVLNSDIINNNIIYSSSNVTSNICVLNSQIINSNLNVLNNINVSSNLNICNNSIILNSNIILNNNSANIQIKTNQTSSPYLKLDNSIKSYNISINNNNNFQLLLDNTKSIIEHNTDNNSISFIGSSFNIFRDVNSNIKVIAGRSKDITIPIDSWYNHISSATFGNEIYNEGKSQFYIYGNFYLNSPTNGNPMIRSYINANNRLRIGINTSIIDDDSSLNNVMSVNIDTYFNSNITVNSNIYLRGTILSASDRNIKTDINIISSPLEKINKINGYTYKRIDTGNYETGLIAQEVLKILPEVVRYNNDIYNISYGNMCGLLVEAIKELNNKIEKLEKKL